MNRPIPIFLLAQEAGINNKQGGATEIKKSKNNERFPSFIREVKIIPIFLYSKFERSPFYKRPSPIRNVRNHFQNNQKGKFPSRQVR